MRSDVPVAWTSPDGPFRPRFPFTSAAAQTVGLALPIWAPVIASETRVLPLPEGGALHVHVNLRPERAPLVLVVHGIGGSSESIYVRRAAQVLLDEGFHVARLDLRGAGGSLKDAPSLYHAGLTSDVELAVQALAAEPLATHVSLLGFSLGGNLVLKLAGEWGASPPGYARAVAAISPVVDLGPASNAFERKRALPYRWYVLRKLLAMARDYRAAFPERAHAFANTPRSSLTTLRAYDAAFVVPMHGFANVDDYYARASSAPLLPRIGLPTFVAFAEDDPMIPFSTVLPHLKSASRHVDVAWTARGGHVGGYETISRAGFVRNWPVSRALAFLRARA